MSRRCITDGPCPISPSATARVRRAEDRALSFGLRGSVAKPAKRGETPAHLPWVCWRSCSHKAA
jgi:hypothetical protein